REETETVLRPSEQFSTAPQLHQSDYQQNSLAYSQHIPSPQPRQPQQMQQQVQPPRIPPRPTEHVSKAGVLLQQQSQQQQQQQQHQQQMPNFLGSGNNSRVNSSERLDLANLPPLPHSPANPSWSPQEPQQPM